MPSISFVVTSYNHPERLETCLKSIRQSIYQDYEIIVSDDGSSDIRNSKLAKKYGAKWVTGDRLYMNNISTRNLPAVFNRAWPLCTGDVIQTLQQDHVIAPDFGLWLARTFDPHALMIGSTDHTTHEFTQRDLDAMLLALHVPDGEVRYMTSMFSGRRLLIELLDWRHMDGLDLAFWHGHVEQLDEKMYGNGHYWMDFIFRLALKGLHFIFNPMMRLWNVKHSSDFYTQEPWQEQVSEGYDYMKEKWGEGIWLTMPVPVVDFKKRADELRYERGLWKRETATK